MSSISIIVNVGIAIIGSCILLLALRASARRSLLDSKNNTVVDIEKVAKELDEIEKLEK